MKHSCPSRILESREAPFGDQAGSPFPSVVVSIYHLSLMFIFPELCSNPHFVPSFSLYTPLWAAKSWWTNLPRVCGSSQQWGMGGLLGLSHCLILSNCMLGTSPMTMLFKWFSSNLCQMPNLVSSRQIFPRHYFPFLVIIVVYSSIPTEDTSTFEAARHSLGLEPVLGLNMLSLDLVWVELLPPYSNNKL